MPFEKWDAGEELFMNLDKEHDLLDRDLRPFAEEADQLQGLQVITGTDDAWGGFAARYMDRLRDDFGKKSIWVWALEGTEKGPRVSLRYLRQTVYEEHFGNIIQGCQRRDALLTLALGKTGTQENERSAVSTRCFNASIAVHPNCCRAS